MAHNAEQQDALQVLSANNGHDDTQRARLCNIATEITLHVMMVRLHETPGLGTCLGSPCQPVYPLDLYPTSHYASSQLHFSKVYVCVFPYSHTASPPAPPLMRAELVTGRSAVWESQTETCILKLQALIFRKYLTNIYHPVDLEINKTCMKVTGPVCPVKQPLR